MFDPKKAARRKMEALRIEKLNINEMINLTNKPSKEEVKKFLIDLIEKQGFTGALQEIKGGRNCRKNSLYVINTICSNSLAKRYNPATMELTWQPSEEKIIKIESFRTSMIELINCAFEENNSKQKEYLRLKNEYGNAMFALAQAYSKLDQIESEEEYIKYSENELDPIRKKLNEVENELDLYTLEFLK